MEPVRPEGEGAGGRGGDAGGAGAAGADAGIAAPSGDSRLWPILITAGLVLVILVNALFIFIAVSGADDVVPSYQTEER